MRIAFCNLDKKAGHQAGRELLHRLYLEETGSPPPQIMIAPGGKPCFADSDYHFSITHTPRHAFCALARCPVGIDAEELDRRISSALVKRILSPREQERYHAAQDPHRAFLALWVLKEASVKLSGKGLRGFPNHTDFCPDDPRVQELSGCLLAILQDGPNEGVTYHAF